MFLPKLNHAFLAICAGDILMLISGTSFSWSSPVLAKLNSTTSPFETRLSEDQGTWITSLVPFGAAIGPFIFGYMADKFGRKLTLLSLGVPFLISYLILAFGHIVELFYVARLIIGMSVGGTFSIMPNYTGEVAEKSIRGVLGSTLSVATCFGMLFSYVLGPYLSVMTFNLVLAVFPALFLVLFSFVGVESPNYYITKEKPDMARAALEKIRSGNVDEELAEIQAKFKEESGGTSLDIIKSKGFIKAFSIAIGLLIFQQFTGISLVYYYTQNIFEQTGASLPPEICSIIIGAVQFMSSFTTPLIIDRLGRKITLMMSAVGMIGSELPLAIFIYLKDQHVDVSAVSFLPILCLTVFIFTYNSGFGPLPWVMLGEVFPSKVKVLTSSVVSCISWTVSFLLTKYFDLFLTFGLANSFFLFAFCCLVAFFFSIFYVVETKGKSLQEIQDILNS